MIPTTRGGAPVTRGRAATLVPQGRRCLRGGQGEEILGRLGAARQPERGPHLAVFLPLATHLRRATEDVARDLVAQILGDDVAGTRDDTEIARYVFGRPAEVRRQREEDRQVRAALALARRAKTPQDLLALAAAQTPAPLRN